MLRVLTVIALLASCLIATACSRPSQPAAKTAEPVQHAAAGTVAGSWDDWCGEHAVPESLCTRCNPTLVAGFQATGDWCAEHGLPESQCLACNPSLVIERPPKPAGP